MRNISIKMDSIIQYFVFENIINLIHLHACYSIQAVVGINVTIDNIVFNS